MSRTYKDRPYWVTHVWTHKYYCGPSGHGLFTRKARRAIRKKQVAYLRRYNELPPRKDPLRYEYYD